MPKPSCIKPETRDLFQHLGMVLMEKRISGTVVPVPTGCMGRCSLGPVLLVEPGHHMYTGLDKAKIERIVNEHIIEGKVVEEYLVPKEFWAEPIPPSRFIRPS